MTNKNLRPLPPSYYSFEKELVQFVKVYDHVSDLVYCLLVPLPTDIVRYV